MIKRWVRIASCCLIVIAGNAAAGDFPAEVLQAKQGIAGKALVAHIDFLASKYCRGRETGDTGMEVAIQYLTDVLKGAGLEPAGEYGTYRQQVRLAAVDLDESSSLTLSRQKGAGAETLQARLEFDFLPVSLSAEREASGPVMFAGYGITAPEHGYDDYKGVDAKGKIVLVMRHEPRENDADSPFDGIKMTGHAALLAKIINAQKHGATGILFVNDPLNHQDMTAETVGGTYWPCLEEKRARDDEDYRFMKFSPELQIIGDKYGVEIPTAAIDGDLAAVLLGDAGALSKAQEAMDRSLKPASRALPGWKVTLRTAFASEPVDAWNLAARVEGSDPVLKDEAVLVGAHYDHAGKDNRGRVYSGADDNASGTAGVLELARAFRGLAVKPKRTILFLLFTAEEKGLLGSRYYVDHPVVPLEKTLAMVDLDMIGRNDVDQISLVGRYQYPRLYSHIDEINRASANLEISFSVESFIENSDHFPFMRKNVPSVFFNSGSHEQLHRPEDTVDRIVPDKIEKVTQLVFLTLWRLADLPPGSNLR
jgi:hypothetical protein